MLAFLHTPAETVRGKEAKLVWLGPGAQVPVAGSLTPSQRGLVPVCYQVYLSGRHESRLEEAT